MAENGDRAGGRGAWLGHRDLSRVDWRAAVRPGSAPCPDPASLDLVLLLALACWVAKRFVEVWLERRRGLAGSRLQVRLVGLFSLIAVTPTIIVAVFSYLFFNFGVESWFSDKVRTAISESVAVADAYVKEHQQAIRADALAMAAGLDRYAASVAAEPAISRAGPDGAGGDARSDRGGRFSTARNDAGAHRSRFRPRVRGCQPGRIAARATGRDRHHDRRSRGAGARPCPAERVQQPVPVCRPVYRTASACASGEHASRGRAIRKARAAALRISDHVRGDLYSRRDAVSRGGDPDRGPFRGADGRSDQRPCRRRRSHPRRRSVGARARGRARGRIKLTEPRL